MVVVSVIAIVVVIGYIVLNRSDKNKTNPNFAPISLGTFSYGGYEFPKLPKDFALKVENAGNQSNTYIEYINSKSLPQIEIEVTNICKGNKYQLGGFSNESVNGVPRRHCPDRPQRQDVA